MSYKIIRKVKQNLFNLILLTILITTGIFLFQLYQDDALVIISQNLHFKQYFQTPQTVDNAQNLNAYHPTEPNTQNITKKHLKPIQQLSVNDSKNPLISESVEQNEEEISAENIIFYFRKRITIGKKLKSLKLLKILITQLELYNITYMAYGGTLIGIWRHHGMIPWDDDIDIVIDSKQRGTFQYAMWKLHKTHQLFVMDESNPIKFKFFSLTGKKTEGYDFRYPYIDIFVMTQISDKTMTVEGEDSDMEVEFIYPLIKREFDGLKLYSPCNVLHILKNIYHDLTKCLSPYYSHELEKGLPEKEITVDCELLKEHYPFVRRYWKKLEDNIKIREYLAKNTTILQIVDYTMPQLCTDESSVYPSDLQLFPIY